jgi:uncharacterized protein YcgI (DUF1989 family)
MLTIIRDDVGRHDFSLPPCSQEKFEIIYADPSPPPGSQGNLERVLAPHGVKPDQVPAAFNILINVHINATSGQFELKPPLSQAGSSIQFRAQMNLPPGLTACSAGKSNNFRFKPIHYMVAP